MAFYAIMAYAFSRWADVARAECRDRLAHRLAWWAQAFAVLWGLALAGSSGRLA